MIEEPTKITEPNLLLVEGPGDEFFFKALVKYQGLQNLQIINAEGTSNFETKLKALSISPQFRTTVSSLGVVRDADTDSDLAFKCVTDVLESANLPVPEYALVPKGGNPQVTVMILPEGGESGMLEDLCLKSVEAARHVLRESILPMSTTEMSIFTQKHIQGESPGFFGFKERSGKRVRRCSSGWMLAISRCSF